MRVGERPTVDGGGATGGGATGAGVAAAGALAAVVVADLWSVDRRFFDYKPPASELFADDPITTRLKQEPKPYRVLDAGVYQGSVLMAYSVQTVLGYHGNEVRFRSIKIRNLP